MTVCNASHHTLASTAVPSTACVNALDLSQGRLRYGDSDSEHSAEHMIHTKYHYRFS